MIDIYHGPGLISKGMIKDDVLNGMCVAFESQSYSAFRLEEHFLPLQMAELCNNLEFRKNCANKIDIYPKSNEDVIVVIRQVLPKKARSRIPKGLNDKIGIKNHN